MYIAIGHSKVIPFFYLHACTVLALGETLNNLCVLKRHTDHLLYGEIILKALGHLGIILKLKLCSI